MCRLFLTHRVRKNIPLPAFWDLNVPGYEPTKISVPGCVESIPAFSRYKGKCTIETRRNFSGNALLTFYGVGHTANVFVDGQLQGSHYGAYGSFMIPLKNMEDMRHTICVEADNSYSEASALHIDNDYYSYLGLTRPVVLEQIDKAFIKWIHVTPEHSGKGYNDGQWNLKVSVCVENISDAQQKMNLALYLSSDDESVAGKTPEAVLPVCLEAGQTETFSCTVQCKDVAAYTPQNPVMYYVHAQLQDDFQNIAFDDLIDRFGFREVKVIGTEILFNGEPLRIKGFNRHEDYAEFGSAVPLNAMLRDICLIKDTGANCVRTCHYPNDERFLDLCDENGLLVWEEGHARGHKLEQMQNPHFMEQSRLTLTEMITQHYNHPAIYVWGLLNECASDTPYGRECYSELIALMRSLDSSRPVTFASFKLWSDLCLDLVDIVSYNIYPMWYHDEDIPEYIDTCVAYIQENGGANKPFLISEIGAGAIYGYRTNTCAKWSEDYQVEALELQISAVMEHKACNGVILWQYCDCRVDKGWSTRRPKTQNNKGVVDIYRREKLGYNKVKEMFGKY